MRQAALFPPTEIPRDRTCPKCHGPATYINGPYLCRNCGAIFSGAETQRELFQPTEGMEEK